MGCDASAVKNYVLNRNLTEAVLRDVAKIPAEILNDTTKREHPCPKCGGETRCRLIDREAGAVFCSHCGRNNGDLLATVRWALDCPFPDAVRAVADYVGMDAQADPSVCKSREVARQEYYYADMDGVSRWRVVRSDFSDGTKSFTQERRENGMWRKGLVADPVTGRKAIPVPYQLHRLGAFGLARVFIVEGEKCADVLNETFDRVGANQYAATTLAGGSSSGKLWKDFAPLLKGREVVVLGDNDKPGVKFADETSAELVAAGIAVGVRYFQPPASFKGRGYDVADWVADS
ncbi:MAG: hypothetical protein HUK22_08030, partial [Thermoguttaceae bacterium]|nr:hypothetical protein [Thermoguttaceae bacterium]